MAFSEVAMKNLDIFTDVLKMDKRTPILFEKNGFVVLTPAIQNNPQQSRFDILSANMGLILAYEKSGIIAIRYFEEILVADIQLFKRHLTSGDCVVFGSKSPKWEYKVKSQDGAYSIVLLRNQKEIALQSFDRDSFIEYMRDQLANPPQYNVIEHTETVQENNSVTFQNVPMENVLPNIHQYISAKGFRYAHASIANLYLSLRSKPFVILSGISGTGKTKIVQLFAEAVGASYDNGGYRLISVRPDWSDSSDLLGYTDLKGAYVRGQLADVVLHALDNPQQPHFVVLDEMNLARVEYYLSDYLSVVESRDWHGERIETAPLFTIGEQSYHLPDNVYIIGTVNMDETTHPFSKKVLDRANSIEFNDIHLTAFDMLEQDGVDAEPMGLSNAYFKSSYLYLKDVYEHYPELVRDASEQLEAINALLKDIYAQVGYRVRDEICFYLAYNEELGLLAAHEAIDFCVMQKILPRIAGAGNAVEDVLQALVQLCEDNDYARSLQKLRDMQSRLAAQGFVSFWSA